MHITDIHIDGFGVWNDLSIDELPDNLAVVFGRNEAGKTTLMQFIRTVLYGFSQDRRERYLPPVRKRLAGGSIYATSARGELEIQRHLDKRDEESVGDIAVTSADGAVGRQDELENLLSGVDESVFNNVFAVGLRELQELATLNDTEAAHQLYKLTTGLDRVSLVDVLRDLHASRQRLLNDDGTPSQITHLIAQRTELRREIDELAARGGRWARTFGEGDRLKGQVVRLEESIQQLEQQARTVELALQVFHIWHERKHIDEQLATFGSLAHVSEDTLEQLETISARIQKRQTQLGSYRKAVAGFREQARAMPVNKKLLSQAARIEAIGELAPWIASLENQIEQLDAEIDQLDEQFRTRYDGLDLGEDVNWDELPEISPRTLSILRGPAKAVRRHSAELSEAKQEQRAYKVEVAAIAEELQTEVSRRGFEELPVALEEAGNDVARLRKRVQLEERIDKMETTREELKEEIDDLLDDQVLPLWKLAVVGIPFVLGVMLILLGIFFPKVLGIAWAVALLGLGGLGVGVVMKIWLERRAREELEDAKEQLHRLREQLQQSRAEREEIDSKLPAGGGPLDVRLTEAESTLEQLEQLLPLNAQVQEANANAEAAGRRAADAAVKLKDARNRWRGALRSVGLPLELTPKAVKELAHRSDNYAQIGSRLQKKQQELQQREVELSSIAERIRTLAGEAGVRLNGEPPRVQLQTLTDALAQHRQVVNERQEVVHRYRRARHRWQRISQSIDRLKQRRAALLSDAGATDEEELQQLLLQQSRINGLRKGRAALNDKINAALGNQCGEEQIERAIGDHKEADLERRWQDLESQRDRSKAEVAQLHQKYGQLTQELKSLGEDRRLDEARLELACLDQQLHDAVYEWKVVSTATGVLQSVREIFESERQPETLKEASEYLNRLTDGQHTRVWTPLDEDVLRVDDEQGESLPVEVLSRGTREAVFLSLRLALISAYARRGAKLPIIFDDVLVNFDADRAKAAAKVLRDFSKNGHQVIFFTCHDHIRKIFKNLKVDIRDLPTRTEIEEEEADEPTVELEEFVEDPAAEEVEEVEAEAEESGEEEEEWEEEEVAENEEDYEEEPDEVEEVAAEEEEAFDWSSAGELWVEEPEEAA